MSPRQDSNDPDDGNHSRNPKTNSRRRIEERMLLRRFVETRDPRAREELVERFMPLARSLALRYRGGGEPVDDLVQVACVGLLKAIDRFDPDRASDFVAFAAPTILGELRHHFRDRSWSVRLPRSLQERSMRIAEVSREISGAEQREASIAEIAELCNLEQSQVIEAMQADRARRTSSLDMPISRGEEDSAPMVELLGDEETGYERAESELASEVAELRPKEREALRLRFHEGMTQREIGDLIGVSQMQVSRLLRSSLGKLLVAVRGGEEVDESSILEGSRETNIARAA
jgi:RNA polymerase sigma-B factor